MLPTGALAGRILDGWSHQTVPRLQVPGVAGGAPATAPEAGALPRPHYMDTA